MENSMVWDSTSLLRKNLRRENGKKARESDGSQKTDYAIHLLSSSILSIA